MARASRSQLALSSGVVAAICPRICRPVRKSLRLKAASASVFRVALVLATAPASLLIWASSLTAESARSSRLKALSAACAETRPSASVAQSAAARTKPIMMELPARTNAAYPIEMREKVTDSWRRNKVAKKSYATLPKRSLAPRQQPAAAQHCVEGGPNATAHRLALSLGHQKGFGTGLARKRIFHIGNAIDTQTVP